MLKYLNSLQSDHQGRYCARRADDIFQIARKDGFHECLVFEPLGLSMLESVSRRKTQTLELVEVKWVATYLLNALSYLHASDVIHTGELMPLLRKSR